MYLGSQSRLPRAQPQEVASKSAPVSSVCWLRNKGHPASSCLPDSASMEFEVSPGTEAHCGVGGILKWWQRAPASCLGVGRCWEEMRAVPSLGSRGWSGSSPAGGLPPLASFMLQASGCTVHGAWSTLGAGLSQALRLAPATVI